LVKQQQSTLDLAIRKLELYEKLIELGYEDIERTYEQVFIHMREDEWVDAKKDYERIEEMREKAQRRIDLELGLKKLEKDHLFEIAFAHDLELQKTFQQHYENASNLSQQYWRNYHRIQTLTLVNKAGLLLETVTEGI
jgi:hypothetical protein